MTLDKKQENLGQASSCQKKNVLFTLVTTVAQVATVAPRSSTAGTLLLFNNSVRTAKKTTLYHYEDQFVNSV
jgi:hypothetical protein